MPNIALVTGATGFIGRHLTTALIQDGWVVRRGTREHADVEAIDAVIHLAANSGRNGSLMSQVMADNLLFPLQLLESAVLHRVPLFINADTCLTPEDSHLRGYALSKKQFRAWGQRHCEGTATRFVNLVLHYVYGPGDNPQKFVPTIIRQCQELTDNLDLTMGDQRKDFLYVSDVISAFQHILAYANVLPKFFAELDCGSETATSIRAFVETVHHLTHSRARLRFGILPYRNGEAMFDRADASMLKSLGWAPQVCLTDGLMATLRGDVNGN